MRGGTILPLAEPVEHVAADTVFALTCRVYGDRPAPATLIEDDGESMAAERGQRTALTLTWTPAAGGALSRSGPFAQPRYRIVGWEVASAAADRDPATMPGSVLVSAGATWKASSAAADDAGSGRLLDAEQGDDAFAFHTRKERQPWVTIDLGRPRTLTGMVILNRADERSEILARAATLTAAISLDGREWVEVWRADGAEREWRTAFAAPRQARFLRLSLAGKDSSTSSACASMAPPRPSPRPPPCPAPAPPPRPGLPGCGRAAPLRGA